MSSTPSLHAVPVKVIVNADDFGISRPVNEAILDLIAGGRVASATLMANGPAICDAARWAGNWPGCSFGAHLNLTEFKPLSRLDRPPITMGNGEMSRRLIEQARPTPRVLQAIYDEFSAQIERLLHLGVPVSHIDSHHHCHTVPQVFPALKAIQIRFRIPSIRPSRNIYARQENPGRALLMKKQLFNFALRALYSSRIPDGFTDLPTLRQMDAEQAGRFSSIEVAVHPGASEQEDETAILHSPWMELLPFAAVLSNYNQL